MMEFLFIVFIVVFIASVSDLVKALHRLDYHLDERLTGIESTLMADATVRDQRAQNKDSRPVKR